MSATPEEIAEPHSFSPDEIAQRIEHFGAAFDLDVMKQAAALIRAQAERVRVLESEVARLSQWEWLNDWDDPEYGSWDSIGSAADDMDMEGVRRVTASRIVADLWIAHRCLTVDDEGDPDDTEAVAFKTAEEAERCWPESLAAARALRGEA